jgi:hypothetical protein
MTKTTGYHDKECEQRNHLTKIECNCEERIKEEKQFYNHRNLKTVPGRSILDWFRR